jgi:hypothetical protein
MTPGLCPHGEEQGKEVLCRLKGSCEFQRNLDLARDLVRCAREAAALTELEAWQKASLHDIAEQEGGLK